MPNSVCILLILVGWGQAVVFNDTAGLFVDWGRTDSENDLTISGGLEDSLIGATADLSTTNYDQFSIDSFEPVNSESTIQARTTTPAPRTTVVSTTTTTPPSSVGVHPSYESTSVNLRDVSSEVYSRGLASVA